ncbi:hypothetical protein [Oscillibacter sp.]|uniref:hypothetical protein n=1 Tax=Oscillibacter sp. TaxID=1945593 RepID=UPI002D80F9DF|nr:hypothetical protein [Oscillibacter sp.]
MERDEEKAFFSAEAPPANGASPRFSIMPKNKGAVENPAPLLYNQLLQNMNYGQKEG